MNKEKFAVLSLSGGMDSSTLLLRLLSEGYQCTCLSFDYGQKHKVELERATELVNYLNSWSRTYTRQFSKITHKIINISSLGELLNSSLVEGGSEVPEGHYAEKNMKDTVVPNRNKIFSSIIQAVALSIATKNDSECSIALGIHNGDHEIYLDCRKEFRDADFFAFQVGNWESERVKIYTPYLETDKFGILQNGKECCELLNLDFNQVYSKTNTSYKPIKYIVPLYSDKELTIRVNDVKEIWFSDYKSASSVERVEAFIKLGVKDPINYADENGPVSWEQVVEHVTDILENHKNK